jgi:hypothetical protein
MDCCFRWHLGFGEGGNVMTAAYNLARIFGGTLLLGSGLIVMALIMEIAR